jgi:hypothetical protein
LVAGAPLGVHHGLIGGPASGEVRSQHHIFSSPIAWAKTAEASGLGAGRFEGHKLGYTGGSNPDADKDAIGEAATQPVSLSRCKKKLAVATSSASIGSVLSLCIASAAAPTAVIGGSAVHHALLGVGTPAVFCQAIS